MSKWSEYTIKELEDITLSGITLVIAHMERYIDYQSKKTIRRLYEAGILMQCNASFFIRLLTRRKALSAFKNGEIHLIGSDCHNLSSRAPRIGTAFKLIEKKLGANALQKHNEFANSILKIKKER
jgi:protein-tyrosine phosphatase